MAEPGSIVVVLSMPLVDPFERDLPIQLMILCDEDFTQSTRSVGTKNLKPCVVTDPSIPADQRTCQRRRRMRDSRKLNETGVHVRVGNSFELNAQLPTDPSPDWQTQTLAVRRRPFTRSHDIAQPFM
jgi:hypothetical protein